MRLLTHVSLCGLLILLAVTPLAAQDTPPGDPGAPPAEGTLEPTPTPEPLPTRGPRPASFAITNDDRAALQFFFDSVLPQGQTRLMRVVGEGITTAQADFLGTVVLFWPAADDSWYGLLSADMETPTAQTNPLVVTVAYNDGTRSTLEASVAVVQGEFINQALSIPAEKGYLLDPVTERAELARLSVLTGRISTQRLWDEDGFILPIFDAINSSFGAVRTFNGTYRTRHTGWDIRAIGGTPIQAMAAGVVVLVEAQPIRGTYVLIDHGVGVFSGYAHLAEASVSVGGRVAQGDEIGTVGDGGRTSGPHFHWEAAVNGVWVDSVQLLELWMP